MNRLLLLSFFVVVSGYFHAQTVQTGSFVYDGVTRSYSYYVPASYVPGQPVPLVMGLHGSSSSGDAFFQYRDFRPAADTANFIIVNPNGTTMLGISFWNYGNVFGSTVDDAGFLEALIDTISAHYSINQQRIYCAGMSNGSFMSYRMACDSDRFAAIGCVTGSMSVSMYNSCNPSYPMPRIHIHGTDDGTNPYAGNSTMKGIEEVTAFWVAENNCNPTPAITNVPNTNTSDNATATRYLYSNGVDGHTVELFKVTGGGHTWPGTVMPGSSGNTCMDFDATKELWRFFSQYERNQTLSVIENDADPIIFWPNPVSDRLNIRYENHVITGIQITNIQGKMVRTVSGKEIQSVDVNGLDPGAYHLNIEGNGFTATRKLMVSN